ncbi:ABC transporter ATP-binding protein [Sphaerisporangium sp. NPDC049003]|uniref:ABC transporter ATP-binding protein n=1 Tax=Sphaerisporangium sp. NPDC049003 TaxID=3364517 RepID=UPI003710594D
MSGSRPASSGGPAGKEAGPSATYRALGVAARLTWRACRGATVMYVVCNLVLAAVPVAVAWLTKLLLDGLSAGAALSSLLAISAGLAVAGVAVAVVGQSVQFLRGEIGRKVGLAAEDELYRSVERFTGLARFEDPPFLDRLHLAQQAASTPALLVDGALGAVRGLLTASGLIVSLAVISPVMTAVVLGTAAPMLVMELHLSRNRAAMFWDIGSAERRELFYRLLLQDPQAAKEIRLFGIGPFLRARMLTERQTADAAKRRVDLRESLVQSGLALLGAAVAGGGLVWAAMAAQKGELTLGDVSMFIAAVAGVQAALTGLLQSFAQAYQQLLLFGHFTAIQDMPPDLPPALTPAALPALRRGIELRDVWFRYGEDHPWVLRGVSLFIPQGSSVGLVGVNGAGKSTLVKLLCRFYDPTRGAILWDGADLRDTDVAVLRRRISAVFQDYMEYDLTAAENIAVGDVDSPADEDRLRLAARRAGIHDVLERLPGGYHTLLTRMIWSQAEDGDPSTGVRLSGGQWQRLALARAFLRDRRDLMILDEPSSGLDAEAEYEVHAKLRVHRRGATTLLISHRLGSIRDADVVVVLADGVIAEQGSHARLMASQGPYARLFGMQSAGYRDDSHADGIDPAAETRTA